MLVSVAASGWRKAMEIRSGKAYQAVMTNGKVVTIVAKDYAAAAEEAFAQARRMGTYRHSMLKAL